MRSFAAGKIDVYFGPKEFGSADDLEQARRRAKYVREEIERMFLNCKNFTPGE
jgi:hypothetical protein